MLVSELAPRILAGDRRALARAATLIEAQSERGRHLLAELFPHTGRARILGLTGPPGAGKSTLADQLAKTLRARGETVGILAVDPSSPFTRGAILGDRIRMQDHHADPGVFIRSMATRGRMGGLARSTLDMSLLLDAAGYNSVLIETVGVGQDEIEIARLADVTVLVLVPGMGDDVQAIKAGTMEIADVFAINKADLPGANRLEDEIRAMQSLGSEEARRDAAPLRRLIASEGQGIEELLNIILHVFDKRSRTHARIEKWRYRLREMLEERLAAALPETAIAEHAARVAEKIEDPYRAVDSILAAVLKHQRMSIEIDHLGIAVRDLEESLRFYRDALGMEVTARATVESEKVNVAMLPAGARIELLEAADAESAIAKFIEKRGPGLHHVALRVDDLAAAVERLRQYGARILNEPRPGAGGHSYVFVHPASAGGVLLELIQNDRKD